MTRAEPAELLPNPNLEHDGELMLVLLERQHADPVRGRVPAYILAMKNRRTGEYMGRISLRVGHSEQIRLYAGHIGYAVDRPYRGRHYAERSCRLLLPLARAHGLTELWITCNPDNHASRRTLERLGGELVEIVDVPPGNPLYVQGDRQKCRFRIAL